MSICIFVEDEGSPTGINHHHHSRPPSHLRSNTKVSAPGTNHPVKRSEAKRDDNIYKPISEPLRCVVLEANQEILDDVENCHCYNNDRYIRDNAC